MTTVDVQNIHATQVKADVLITTVSPGGLWYGGMDDAIKRVSKTYHFQLGVQTPLRDGQMVYLQAPETGYDGKFGSVLFVVDGLRQPLSRLIVKALGEVDRIGMNSVVLPTFRTGALLGVVEKTIDGVLGQLAGAVNTFVASRTAAVRNITIAVDGATNNERILKERLRT